MLEKDRVREDLKKIRYYYSRREVMNSALDEVGANDVIKIVQKYNAAIRFAPPRLYDLYISLYVNYLTQEALAYELCCSPQYIQKLNGKLVEFFQSKISY